MGRKDATPQLEPVATEPEAEQPYEAVGNFEQDYPKLCEKYNTFAVKVNILTTEVVEEDPENPTITPPFNGPPTIDIGVSDDDEPISARISGWPLEPPMARALLESFEALSSISTVFFSNAGLTDETVGLILQSFTPDSTLVALHISNNKPQISQTTFERLISPRETKVDTYSLEDDVSTSAGVMKSPLQVLTLRYCGVNDAGAAGLAAALKDNHTLTSLNLYGNDISDDGASTLVRSLRVNRTLRMISLGRNLIGDTTAFHLADAVVAFELTHDEVVSRRRLLLSPEDDDDDHKGKGGRQGISTGARMTKSSSKSKVPTGKDGRSASGKGKNKLAKGKGTKGMVEEDEPVRRHPFLDASAKTVNGPILCEGNTSLVSVNFAYNKISRSGVNRLVTALKLQNFDSESRNCLLRLQLNGNKVSQSDVLMKELKSLLVARDPYYKHGHAAKMA